MCPVGPASRQLSPPSGGRVPGPPAPTECPLGPSAQSGPQFPGLQPGSKWGAAQTVRVLKAAFLKPSSGWSLRELGSQAFGEHLAERGEVAGRPGNGSLFTRVLTREAGLLLSPARLPGASSRRGRRC